MKILVGIPVHNEENNIGELLKDILAQKLPNDTSLDVIVVSDNSTDNTDKIVAFFTEKYKNIRLIKRYGNREGKYDALNLIFDISERREYDILILFDGDIRLGNDTLNFLLGRDTDLIAGNPIPYKPKNKIKIGERAAFFSWAIVDNIKNKYPAGLYHTHGRVLALSKKLYDKIRIPKAMSVGDDQFIYLYCIKNGFKFDYSPKAIVFFKLPQTMKDHLRQSIRFSEAIKEKEICFGKEILDHLNNINKPLIFLKTFVQYPYEGLCWLIGFAMARLSIIAKRQKVIPAWEISKTTK